VYDKNVCSTFQYKVSPIETAIEGMSSSNKKLTSVIEHQMTDPTARADSLGMFTVDTLRINQSFNRKRAFISCKLQNCLAYKTCIGTDNKWS